MQSFLRRTFYKWISAKLFSRLKKIWFVWKYSGTFTYVAGFYCFFETMKKVRLENSWFLSQAYISILCCECFYFCTFLLKKIPVFKIVLSTLRGKVTFPIWSCQTWQSLIKVSDLHTCQRWKCLRFRFTHIRLIGIETYLLVQNTRIQLGI